MEELIRKQDALDVISHELRCVATADAPGLEVACDLINEMTAPESYGHAVERFEDLCEYFGYYTIWGAGIILLIVFVRLAWVDTHTEKGMLDQVPRGH